MMETMLMMMKVEIDAEAFKIQFPSYSCVVVMEEILRRRRSGRGPPWRHMCFVFLMARYSPL
jgi:hypothetical protein